MALDFTKTTFGALKQNGNVQPGQPSGSTKDKPKAQLWINIGYDSGVPEEDGNGTRFVSLPFGIGVDNQDTLPTNSRNAHYAAFNQARNDLLSQIMEAGSVLEPGESVMLNLQVQLRRVNDAMPETAVSDNPFVRKLNLVA